MKTRLTLAQVRKIVVSLIFLVLAGGIGYWLGSHDVKWLVGESRPAVRIERSTPADREEIDFSLFWEVWDRLEASYLKKEAIEPGKMVYGAISGMVAALGDPYTVFLPPEENTQAKEDLGGSFEGVGIQLGYKDGNLAVVAPLAGMPAERAGVKAGDYILKIDEREAMGVSLPEAVRLIRGQGGTSVKLTMLRENTSEPFEVTLTRETILVSSVELKTEEGIAHLALLRFGERTFEEWDKAVSEILAAPDIKGVILDLRNNPGGLLNGSIFIASEFLDGGVVVIQESADGQKETYSVNRQGKMLKTPLVVLINEGSASASEIVAGALRDHDRAEVVGQKSFGKGTIQEAEDLTGGAGIHITTARWLLPDGGSIDQNGVQPDVEVADNPDTEEDEQFGKAREELEKLL